MRTKLEPLLCELHAHTTWSDGVLTTREPVDLYGRSGFDVLCVTCVADEDAVVGYLRSPLPVFLARLDRSAAEVQGGLSLRSPNVLDFLTRIEPSRDGGGTKIVPPCRESHP